MRGRAGKRGVRTVLLIPRLVGLKNPPVFSIYVLVSLAVGVYVLSTDGSTAEQICNHGSGALVLDQTER